MSITYSQPILGASTPRNHSHSWWFLVNFIFNHKLTQWFLQFRIIPKRPEIMWLNFFSDTEAIDSICWKSKWIYLERICFFCSAFSGLFYFNNVLKHIFCSSYVCCCNGEKTFWKLSVFDGTLRFQINVQVQINVRGWKFAKNNKCTGPNKHTWWEI